MWLQVSADILRPQNVFWNGQDQPCANLVCINKHSETWFRGSMSGGGCLRTF